MSPTLKALRVGDKRLPFLGQKKKHMFSEWWGGDFSLKIRTEDNMKYAKENSGSYPTGSLPRCPLFLLVPPEGIYLSEYKACSPHSNEAINTTGNAGYRRTKHIFCQAPARKERFIICSNKYV